MSAMMPNMSIWPRRKLHLSERLVQDGPQRRIALLIAVTGLIIGILAAAAIVSALIVETHWSSSDKATVIGDVIAGATLLLAVVAGLVAALAYAVSTGAPDLRVRVGSAGNSFGYPRIQLKDGDDLNSPRDYELIIMLKNISSYSARNPVVTVQTKGLTFLDVESGAWETIERNFFPPNEGLAAQWNGGVNYSLHGHSIRRLPPLRFEQFTCSVREDTSIPLETDIGTRVYPVIDPDTFNERSIERAKYPAFELEILAEGYRRVVTVRLAISRWPSGESIFTPDSPVDTWRLMQNPL
jgi:hypothetical protein